MKVKKTFLLKTFRRKSSTVKIFTLFLDIHYIYIYIYAYIYVCIYIMHIVEVTWLMQS